MRVVVLVLSALALSAGCAGDDASDGGGLDETLRSFPADTTLLAVVSTDLESEQFKELEAYVRRRFGRGAEAFLRHEFEQEDVSWEDDVKPPLGGELLHGFSDAPFVSDTGGEGLLIAFRSTDGDGARDILEKLEFEPLTSSSSPRTRTPGRRGGDRARGGCAGSRRASRRPRRSRAAARAVAPVRGRPDRRDRGLAAGERRVAPRPRHRRAPMTGRS